MVRSLRQQCELMSHMTVRVSTFNPFHFKWTFQQQVSLKLIRHLIIKSNIVAMEVASNLAVASIPTKVADTWAIEVAESNQPSHNTSQKSHHYQRKWNQNHKWNQLKWGLIIRIILRKSVKWIPNQLRSNQWTSKTFKHLEVSSMTQMLMLSNFSLLIWPIDVVPTMTSNLRMD